MAEWKKGWKVIDKNNRGSCTGSERTNSCFYPNNKIITKPHLGGPLAVFTTREAARKFKNAAIISHYNSAYYKPRYNPSNWTIKKCIYIESKHKCLWEWKKSLYESMLHNKKKKRRFIMHELPAGTAFADKVKCLE